MYVTSNMLNNKVDLSKMNTQFAPGDSASAKEELSVVDDSSTTDTIDETNNLLSDEDKIKVYRAKVKSDAILEATKTVVGFVGDTIELARKVIEGSTSPLELAVIMKVDLARMAEKREEMVETVASGIMDAKINTKLMEENPTLAVNRAIVDNRREDREEEREEPRFTVEDGELCSNGVPVKDGAVKDLISTLVFGAVENEMLDNLNSLLDDFASDISVGDMSNMEDYLEKLNGYKDSLLSVLADLEHEEGHEVTITKYKDQEATYQACLAMQPNILQPTLSDYVS